MDRTFQVRFVAEYQSVARKRYRTRINMRGWDQYGDSEDRSSLEYERCDDAMYKRNAKERLRRVARGGDWVCYLCGDEVSRVTPPKEAELERKFAKLLWHTRDADRTPRWKFGLWGKVRIAVCANCEGKTTPPMTVAAR